MDKNKKENTNYKKIKSYYKIADGFSLKYIPMFFMISAASKIVLKFILHREMTSRFTGLAVMITAIVVSLIWTKLDMKTKISIFDRPLTKYHKKQALSQRATAIVIFYIILSALKSGETSNHIISVISKKIVEVSFTVCVIVLILSFIIIALRRTVRPVRR